MERPSAVRLRRLVGVLAAACLAVTTLSVPVASAAAPVAQDDTLAASPSGALDVMANDSGDPAGSLRVAGNSQPGHGTASCSALGACLYRAAAGFTGSDSFNYTVRDGNSAEATATVSVTVGAAPGAGAPVARDDDTATLAGHATTVDVLGNDSGSGLTVTANSTSEHGTVTCSPGGACVYTPTDGFVGTDGFTYEITDGSARTSDAAVHVIVSPAATGYGIGVAGHPQAPVGGAVPGGGLADWTVQIASLPPGISGQALAAIARPQVSVALAGPHALSGTPTAAPGWTVTTGSGSLALSAKNDALLGEAVTRTFPRPLPPISQGSGGDGHVPILVGSKVFAFFHHSHPTSVTCVDRATGDVCPGYPKELNMGSTDINGPAAVVGTRIYTHLLPASGYTQTAPIALFCWDAATDSTCGLTIVDRVVRTSDPGASAPVLAAGKVWFGGDTGKLYCVEPASGDPCAAASLDTGLPEVATSRLYDIVTHGARVFLSRSNDTAACVDVVAGGTCTGWATPKTFADSWNLVTQHDATGAAVGICVFQLTVGECITDADPGTRVPVDNFVAKEAYYSVTLEAEAGTRTLVGALGANGLGCYDWATMAPCTGGGYAADGWLSQDSGGASLPTAYGATFDGACVVALGDPGRIFTVDPAGTSPCLSLNSGADRVSVDLRDQRCDGTVGAAKWKDVRLTDAKPGEFEFVRATVRDAATQEVLADGDLIAHDGTLDLSSIDASKHPAVTVDATAKSTSSAASTRQRQRANVRVALVETTTPWSDGIPPRLTIEWGADPAPLCATTKAEDQCTGTPAPISLLGHLTTPGDASAEARLNTTRGQCPAQAVLGATATQRKPAASRTCQGRRSFLIHIRIKGSKVRTIRVTVGTKRQKVLRVRPRPVARIDLTKLPRQTLRVTVRIRTRAGKVLKGTRTYHPCTKKKPGTGFKF